MLVTVLGRTYIRTKATLAVFPMLYFHSVFVMSFMTLDPMTIATAAHAVTARWIFFLTKRHLTGLDKRKHRLAVTLHLIALNYWCNPISQFLSSTAMESAAVRLSSSEYSQRETAKMLGVGRGFVQYWIKKQHDPSLHTGYLVIHNLQIRMVAAGTHYSMKKNKQLWKINSKSTFLTTRLLHSRFHRSLIL